MLHKMIQKYGFSTTKKAIYIVAGKRTPIASLLG